MEGWIWCLLYVTSGGLSDVAEETPGIWTAGASGQLVSCWF